MEDSRKTKKVLKALNASFIALIPKQKNAMTPNGFRPIALSNVVYKIISKVISNRLKPLLPSLISEEIQDMWKEYKSSIIQSKLMRWYTPSKATNKLV